MAPNFVGLTVARDQPAVAELFDEDAPQYVGETPSTPPSTPQRCAQLSLAMPRPSPATASEYLAPSGRRILEMPGLHGGSASGHHVACLGVCPLPAGRGASWQVFEWSLEVCSRPPKLELGPHRPHRPYLGARSCACMRGQVRPRSPRDGSTAPARRPSSVRWPAPPSPPLEASSRPAATARARCAPRAKNRTGACVHASQPPRAPPTAAAVASALPQPKVHATHGLTRLVRAALAVVRATDVSPASRQ